MDKKLIALLKKGRIAVIPTDTIYGIVGLALSEKTVEEIYHLRKRATDKPLIILISGLDDLQIFNVKLTDAQMQFLQKNWPNPLSVVLPVNSEKFKYLHRGKNSLAFRMPKDQQLLGILKETGPLVAPSANYEDEKPSGTIKMAKNYFGDSVDLYIDKGQIKSEPSTIIELASSGKVKVLRDGQYRV